MVGENSFSDIGERAPWDPEAHLARVRALLPQDGAVMAAADLAAAMGNTTTKGTIDPLHQIAWDALGLRIYRNGRGRVVGVGLWPRPCPRQGE